MTAYLANAELPTFKKYVKRAGAQLLQPTNPYEVLRYKRLDETGVIYRNGKDSRLKATGCAEDHIQAMRDGKQLGKRPKRTEAQIRRLLKRDGDECFYCGQPIPPGEETIEHILSVKDGGSNSIENCALAHEECNQRAGSMPVVKKIKLRDQMRAEAAQ